MELFGALFCQNKVLFIFPGCHDRGEMCREPRERGAFGRGKEVRGWPLTGKEVVQASQDQADLVMAAPIM